MNPLKEDTSQVGSAGPEEAKLKKIDLSGVQAELLPVMLKADRSVTAAVTHDVNVVLAVFQNQAAKRHLCQLGGLGALPPLLPHPISK